MYNYFMLIGKKKSLTKMDNNDYLLSLEVTRPFREDGVYKTDVFNIRCCQSLMGIGIDAFDKINILSVKGRIVVKENNIELVAERIMFTQ